MRAQKMPKKDKSGLRIAKENIQRIISEFTGKNIISLLVNNSVTCCRFIVIHFT